MFTREVTTGIQIEGPPPRVGSVLTAFAAYAEWNPFIRPAEGKARCVRRPEARVAGTG